MAEPVPGRSIGFAERSDGLLGFEYIDTAGTGKVAIGVRPTPGLTRSADEHLVGAQRGHGRTEEVAGGEAGALQDADAAVLPGVVGPVEMDFAGSRLARETARGVQILGIAGGRSDEDVVVAQAAQGPTEAIPLGPLAVWSAQHLQDIPGCVEDGITGLLPG